MMQLLVNAVLGVGYVAGLMLVWIGMEMFAIDGRSFAPSLLSVAAGIALWAGLVSVGKQLHRSATRQLEGPR
jgi:hypothetical protein